MPKQSKYYKSDGKLFIQVDTKTGNQVLIQKFNDEKILKTIAKNANCISQALAEKANNPYKKLARIKNNVKSFDKRNG